MHVGIEGLIVDVLFDLHLFWIDEFLLHLIEVDGTKLAKDVISVGQEVVWDFVADVLVLFVKLHNVPDLMASE